MDSLYVDLSWPIWSTINIILCIISRIPCHFRHVLCHFRQIGDAILPLLGNWAFHDLGYLRGEMTSEIDYQGVSNTHEVLDASPIRARVTKGLTEEGRSDLAPCHFRQVLCHFRQIGWIDDFLRNSLTLIQWQYKRTPVGAKGTVWAAEARAIFTFSAMVGPKPHKHISLKPLNPLILKLYIFSFQFPNFYTLKKLNE